ncbi:hypothetical protein SAMN06295998_101197 [Primorskyibacter flagellatus]|uniref:Uncharacterized protein n=1 Tax=Primorskyibacter flagellatus TaxID=1387277 RepID=A0A1W1Z4R6_9RHOB|nr:hypothetical protein SAMN06295998_101197 [Primorskyibacter flagellatus]
MEPLRIRNENKMFRNIIPNVSIKFCYEKPLSDISAHAIASSFSLAKNACLLNGVDNFSSIGYHVLKTFLAAKGEDFLGKSRQTAMSL